MNNYKSKFQYLVNKFGPHCPIAHQRYGKIIKATELHHLSHNVKWRRELYPLFINSIINLRPVSHKFHIMHGSWGKIGDTKAGRYQRFLKEHPKFSEAMNDPKIHNENYYNSISSFF